MMNPFKPWRTLVSTALALLSAISLGSAHAAGPGEAKFNSICVACHTIGGGKRVGPDLLGVTERRSEEWLLKFIHSSQSVVKSGDPYAVKLFEEFNKTPMPDMPQFSDVDIRDILAHIGAGVPAAPSAPATPPVATPPSPEDIERGRRLFQGLTRLENVGPACNSCHHVTNDAVIGGGVLAKDLTLVFSRVGAPGVSAILGQPPFPVMQVAYAQRPITADESRALVAFLQDADNRHALQTPVDYGRRLVLGGTGGFAVLLSFYGIAWRKRKARPVNHAIFDRQVRSR